MADLFTLDAVTFASLRRTDHHDPLTLAESTYCVVLTAAISTNTVPLIKAVRAFSGFGLKESKDIVDGLREGKRHQFEPRPWLVARTGLDALHSAGANGHLVEDPSRTV